MSDNQITSSKIADIIKKFDSSCDALNKKIEDQKTQITELQTKVNNLNIAHEACMKLLHSERSQRQEIENILKTLKISTKQRMKSQEKLD